MSFRSYIKVGRRAAYEGRYTSRVNPTEVSVGGEGVDIDLSDYVTAEEFAADQARQDGGSSYPSGTRLLRFKQDTSSTKLQPGEFTLMEGNTFVNYWSRANSVYFRNTAADGTLLVPGEKPELLGTYLGAAMTTLSADGDQMFLRIAPFVGSLSNVPVIAYQADYDLWTIVWKDSNKSLLAPGDPYVLNGTDILFSIPDLFI